MNDIAVHAEDQASAWRAPRWASPISLGVAVLGIGVSSYLTYEHYTGNTTLACSNSGTINCARVTSSPQSHFLGIPVAVLGLAFFVAMAVLCLPFAWRRPERLVRLVRLVAAGGGVAMILWLVYAELFIIDAICLWCTGVHALTLVLFAAVGLATASGVSRRDDGLDGDFGDDDPQDG